MLRRRIATIAAMAVMVGLFPAVGYAATIEGTNQGSTEQPNCSGLKPNCERLQESSLNDTIFGHGGPDYLDANDFTNDTDVANGNRGQDDISVRDQDALDTANGGPGVDTCYGDPGDELNCEVVNPDL